MIPAPSQHYNIRENFNIIENPNGTANYLDNNQERDTLYTNHYNILLRKEKQHNGHNGHSSHTSSHQPKIREHEPLLVQTNQMPKVLCRSEHSSKYEGVNYQRAGVSNVQSIQSDMGRNSIKRWILFNWH